MTPNIIGLVGPVRAGKSTAAQYLAKSHGYTIASNSSILQNILFEMELPATRKNLARLGDSIFKTMGNEIIARYRIANLKENDLLVIDGIRYIEEVMVYRNLPNFSLLGIDANEESRFMRTKKSSEIIKDKRISSSDFTKLAKLRSESHIPQLMDMADILIDNNYDLIGLEYQLSQAIKQIVNSRTTNQLS